jgi:hypothetical protein
MNPDQAPVLHTHRFMGITQGFCETDPTLFFIWKIGLFVAMSRSLIFDACPTPFDPIELTKESLCRPTLWCHVYVQNDMPSMHGNYYGRGLHPLSVSAYYARSDRFSMGIRLTEAVP